MPFFPSSPKADVRGIGKRGSSGSRAASILLKGELVLAGTGTRAQIHRERRGRSPARPLRRDCTQQSGLKT